MNRPLRWLTTLALPWAVPIALLLGSQRALAGEATVYAAASLTNAVQDVVKAWQTQTGHRARTSFAASSALARQIENGAPASVFLSADEQWMDYLERRRLIDPGSRTDLLGNRLVLITPLDSQAVVELEPGFDLARLLGTGRLATGDPAHVPVGQYARAALTHLGVWALAEKRLVRADSVRAALAYVERGEVPAGIVYATDAAVAPRVRVAGIFPATSHPPIVYPMALVSGQADEAAKSLHAFLRGDQAGGIFKRYGFSLRPAR
ncbi:molybdate ABC transporter substrate-binding protein [Schlegelella sp. S2-27]|uniref:Molybdate ABC transporter substrate-binding protein n=1 Tax=Caldimonas mangrovi TaxID=2944811 RepID=A0ABT0YND4_9BURK|nr:molybdate ABC transporter substrate-binding protein [Caldimonas mangrovi]MCM5679934.1 molybdate ABC transporter substrate-binding protein [Caldimonas mangrovi]